jgi:hypothetical protein
VGAVGASSSSCTGAAVAEIVDVADGDDESDADTLAEGEDDGVALGDGSARYGTTSGVTTVASAVSGDDELSVMTPSSKQ